MGVAYPRLLSTVVDRNVPPLWERPSEVPATPASKVERHQNATPANV